MKISNPQEIRIEDYNYNLPDERIAKYPLEKRDNSKMLIYQNGEIKDEYFYNITNYIPANSLLIFNNTKVIQARLQFRKSTGAQIEIFCLEPHSPNDYQINFQQNERCSWVCLIGNLKKWREGSLSKEIEINGKIITISATRIASTNEAHTVEFSWDNSSYTFSELLDVIGELPIPPYLNRDTEEKDKETYQTVYSKIEGSVAAPTAGLHFTPNIIEQLQNKGIQTNEVTLHVGAGTFKPVKSELIKDHAMHSELISVKKEIIEQLLQHNGKIIAVGTTSVRTLESLYYLGVKLKQSPTVNLSVSQWDPYQEENNHIEIKDALQSILEYLEKNNLSSIVASTQIMIAPGYDFKIVKGIVTNFHQPQSTLLLLVSAFIGENKWKTIYKHALNNDYRFLSYGDSSLLLKD